MKRKFGWLAITGLLGIGTVATMSNRQYLLAQIGIQPTAAGAVEPLEGASAPGRYGYPVSPYAQPYPSPYAQVVAPNSTAPQALLVPGQSVQAGGATIAPAAAQHSFNRFIPPNAIATVPGLPGGQLTTATSYNVTYASPASFQEEQRIQGLLNEYQSASDDDKRRELISQITKAVTHQFEERQVVRERELKELEERLSQLKEKHAKRESLKDKIITDRVSQLINNADGLGWGNEPSPWLSQPVVAPMSMPPLFEGQVVPPSLPGTTRVRAARDPIAARGGGGGAASAGGAVSTTNANTIAAPALAPSGSSPNPITTSAADASSLLPLNVPAAPEPNAGGREPGEQ